MVTGKCANEWFPVVQGASWKYKSTGSPAGKYTFTDTISTTNNDGFTLTSQLGDQPYTQNWSCADAGLADLQFSSPIMAVMNSQDLNFSFNFSNMDGVTYPLEMNPDDGWQHTFEFEGKKEIGGEPATATGSAQTVFAVLGTESVKVPAGTFQAVKVQEDLNIVFTIQVQGITVPASFTGTYAYWYVKGVGWVKAEGQGNITGTSFTETIELQSYNIP